MTKHDVAELLPFYANGTLDADERARVDAELATCETCTRELREIEALAASLRDRAAGTPALSPRIFDETLARIGTTPAAGAVTTLRTAWWGVPARYATAAMLVLGFGTASFAAYHQFAAQFDRNGHGEVVDAGRSTSVFRVTPNPAAPQAADHVAKNAPPAPAGAAGATVAKQHRLAKKARVALLVRDVEASLKGARRVVRDAGGEITSLANESPRTTETIHTATLNVEVPADRLESTLDHLGLLGTVENRAIDAEDLDATIVDQEARLRNLRREESDLRALMDKGGKVTDILTVQENLSNVRGQIEQLEAQHRGAVHRVATSTIEIALTEDRPNPAPVKPGPSARIDGAWHSGLNALADTVVALLSTIAWCVAYAPVPLGLAGLAYGALRAFRKRVAAPG